MNQFGVSSSSVIAVDGVERQFITKVYGWMALALALTGFVASAAASNIEPLMPLLRGPGMLILIVVQLGVVFALSLAINKMSAGTATVLFLAYSVLTGLTLSTLFFVYTSESIASTFFVTAGTFAMVSAYGYVTKTDLTKIGNLLLMGLIGIILASLVNIFLQSSALYWVTTYVGVLIFVGLIAYDTQRIKNMARGIGEDSERIQKAAVMGALALYLDFINLFIRLLRIFGRRR